jgi:hypothetical protein
MNVVEFHPNPSIRCGGETRFFFSDLENLQKVFFSPLKEWSNQVAFAIFICQPHLLHPGMLFLARNIEAV